MITACATLRHNVVLMYHCIRTGDLCAVPYRILVQLTRRGCTRGDVNGMLVATQGHQNDQMYEPGAAHGHAAAEQQSDGSVEYLLGRSIMHTRILFNIRAIRAWGYFAR